MKALIISFLIIMTTSSFAQPEANNPYAVTTFECIGIYYKVDTENLGECRVSYRPAGTNMWKEAMPLWFDRRDLEYRGSIIGLVQNTDYQIRLTLAGKQLEFKSKTLNEKFKIGKKTYLNHGISSETLYINESGSPDAYHLIAPSEKSRTTVDVRNSKEFSVVIDADYVILRGIELKNAAKHGVFIKEGRHHVVIEECRDLSVLFGMFVLVFD